VVFPFWWRERKKGLKGSYSLSTGSYSQTLKMFTCRRCGKKLATAYFYLRHKRANSCFKGSTRETNDSFKKYMCSHCNSSFNRKATLKLHYKLVHSKDRTYVCVICNSSFNNKKDFITHQNNHEKEERKVSDFISVSSSHRKACEHYKLVFDHGISTIHQAFVSMNQQLFDFFKMRLQTKKFFKAGIIVMVRMIRSAAGNVREEEEEEEDNQYLTIPVRSPTVTFTRGSNIQHEISEAMYHIQNSVDELVMNGSGWAEEKVLSAEIELAECRKLAGSCGLHEYVFVRGGKGKKQVVTHDELKAHEGSNCFFLAIAAHFLSKDCTKEDLETFVEIGFNTKDIKTPVEIKDISLFEKQNSRFDIGVNVIFEDEEGDVYPILASKKPFAKNNICLLLYYTDSNELHYALLRDPQRMLSSISASGRKSKKYPCYNCFHTYTSEQALMFHLSWCSKQDSQIKVYPYEGEEMKFKDFQKTIMSKYVVFFDFESCMKSTNSSCQKCIGGSKSIFCPHQTHIVNTHHAISYSLIVVDSSLNLCEHKEYVGEDAAEHFLHCLIDIGYKYGVLCDSIEPLQMNEEDILNYNAAKFCAKCNLPFTQEDFKVRHHNHQSGEYVSAMHTSCNLRMTESNTVYCLAHNTASYDTHLIIRNLSKVKSRIWNVHAIPLNTEKVKTLTINNLQILDSFAFLPSSLEKLVDNLNKSNHPYPIMNQWITDPIKKKLLLQKGVYPYSYFNSAHHLKNHTSFPPRWAFFNDLNQEHISEEAYEHGLKVWDAFQCQTMAQYCSLYNSSDTILLAEAVMTMRNMVAKHFDLDMLQYLSLPHLTKDCMLYSNPDLSIEYMHDPEMIEMVRRGIRGGVSFISTRFVDVKALSDKFKTPYSCLYADCNNLYGHAMKMKLPVGQYEFMSQEELDNFDPMSVDPDDEHGYILEVELLYPPNMHKIHSSYPLAPENVEVGEEDLTEDAEALWKHLRNGQKFNGKKKKLSSSFNVRKHYVTHCLNLKFYLSHGMKLVRLIRGIRFKQEAFLKSHITTCSKERAASNTIFMSDLWKLFSNR